MIFSIIVPVFNEEKTILKILNTLNNLSFLKFKKEIIVVDDGSTDSTRNILNQNKSLYSSLYFNEKNMGKGAAVKLGLKNCKGDYVVFQDADLEYDPNDLIKFEEVFLKFVFYLSILIYLNLICLRKDHKHSQAYFFLQT